MSTIRLHIKALVQPFTSIDTMITSMRNTYAQYGIGVTVASYADLSGLPAAAALMDLDVGACTSGGSTPEQGQLFRDGNANWSGWIALGRPSVGMTGGPATIARNSGVCNIYARGGDNKLWQRAYYNGQWHDWAAHNDGGVLASIPSLGSMGPDHEHVFVRGTDGQVWQKWWTAAGGWSGWIPLGAPNVGFQGGPVTISRNPSVCNIYVRGGDNKLWQRAYYNGQWHDWTPHNDGGVLASVPALGSMGPDHEHVFVRGTDGQVWQKYWTAAGGWSGWFALGGPGVGFIGAPSTISRNSGVCNIYVRGGDNSLWQRAYYNNHWDGWTKHIDGGVLDSEPAPGSMNPNHEHVFVRGTDGQVWQKWWIGPTRGREIVVFFIRSTNGVSGPLNGCASYPSGYPGAVVTQVASQWTMAHEVGHVLGLPHISENCTAPGYQPTRLMTGCGTSRLINPPPDLISSEISTITASPLMS